MKSILIAGVSKEIASTLSASLSCKYKIYICSDRCAFPSVLKDLRPDALIIYAPFISIDGLRRLLANGYTPPVLVVLTNILTDQFLLSAQKIGAGCVFRIPFSSRALVSRLCDLLDKQ